MSTLTPRQAAAVTLIANELPSFLSNDGVRAHEAAAAGRRAEEQRISDGQMRETAYQAKVQRERHEANHREVATIEAAKVEVAQQVKAAQTPAIVELHHVGGYARKFTASSAARIVKEMPDAWAYAPWVDPSIPPPSAAPPKARDRYGVPLDAKPYDFVKDVRDPAVTGVAS